MAEDDPQELQYVRKAITDTTASLRSGGGFGAMSITKKATELLETHLSQLMKIELRMLDSLDEVRREGGEVHIVGPS